MAVNLDILFPNATRWISPSQGERGELPVFVSDRGVQGTIVVSPENSRRPVSGMIKVALEGTLYNHVDLIGQSSGRLYHTYIYQKIINLNAVYPEQQIISNGGQRYNFSFVIPNDLASAAPSKYGQGIPPSLNIHFTRTSRRNAISCSKGTCSIEYRIRAQFLAEGHRLVEKIRSFTLWTSQGRQPPVCTEDFPGEYQMSAFKTLRSPLFQPTGRLLVYSHEPPPLEFSPEKEGAATSVRLRLRYESLKNGSGMRIPPPRFHGIVRSNLHASTSISIEPQKRSPATSDAPVFPFTFETRKSYASQLRKLCFARWTPLETETGTLWESEADLAVPCDYPAYLTPSFSSLLVSRRYSLKIYMAISGLGHAALKLELPIQVVYTGGGRLLPEETSYSNGPTEGMPPAYSP